MDNVCDSFILFIFNFFFFLGNKNIFLFYFILFYFIILFYLKKKNYQRTSNDIYINGTH